MDATLAVPPVANLTGMTPLDLASGMLLGTHPGPPLPAVRDKRPIKDIFGDADELMLATGRCFVTFSGGRDSSSAIASVTATARERGYADPIPVTLRYAGVTPATEIEAQERVISHLGLKDWERVEIGDELEIVGPVAQGALRRFGVLFPANAYALLPAMERAAGGILDIAIGGADFFAFWRWAPLADVLAGHRRPTRRDAALLGASLLPARTRSRVAARRGIPPAMPWLMPQAEKEALNLLTGRAAKVPLRFDHAVKAQLTHRCFAGGLQSLKALGESVGTQVVQPLYDPKVIAEGARTGGWRGYGGRGRALDHVAGHLLPPGALQRREGSQMQEILFGERTRAFAEQWSGRGLDEALVRPEVLRELWLGPRPDVRTAGLLQAAWLHDEQDAASSRGVDQELTVPAN